MTSIHFSILTIKDDFDNLIIYLQLDVLSKHRWVLSWHQWQTKHLEMVHEIVVYNTKTNIILDI